MIILDSDLQRFFLIFARVAVIVLTAPMLSSRGIPPLARGGLVFFLALVIYPSVQYYNQPVEEGGLYLLMLVLEIIEGLLISLIINLIFSTFQIAGQFFALQMGFSSSQVYDATADLEIPVLGEFLGLIGLQIFLTAEIFHHFVLQGLINSFITIPVPKVIFAHGDHLINVVLSMLQNSFEQALYISLPIIGILLILSVTMGLLAKSSPQMNIFVLGFPLQVGLGFIMLLFALPFILPKMTDIISSSIDNISMIIVLNK